MTAPYVGVSRTWSLDAAASPKRHTAMATARASFGVVVLSQGLRAADLDRGLRSMLAQTGVDLDIVVIGNGWQPTDLPDGVKAVGLPDDVGIPGGRNAGVRHVRGDLLFFLDDDARLRDTDMLERIADMFVRAPDLGLVQPRVVDPDGRPAPRRWTPRLRVGDPARSSDVTAVWEGAVAIRRGLFEQIGGWPGEFRYMHEGIDLAWAVWDAGARVHYAGDLIAVHPATSSSRRTDTHRMSMRNRVFLARRRLPVPLAAIYVALWGVLTVVRTPSRAIMAESLRGAIQGIRDDPGPRRPMSWRTVWRMTRTGRPPII